MAMWKKNKYNDCNEMQWYGAYLVARTRRRSEHQGQSAAWVPFKRKGTI